MTEPTKERVKEVMEEVDAMDLSDGAHWAMVHDQLGLDYGEVFDIIASDPDYFSDFEFDGDEELDDEEDN